MHGDKNWEIIAALVSGRSKVQCYKRWHDVFNLSSGQTAGSTGRWTSDEDDTLNEAIRIHNGKNWPAIAALVSGRTNVQCYGITEGIIVLNPSSGRTPGRTHDPRKKTSS
jgi:hypothetical protein